MQLAANSQLPGSFEGVFLLLERMAAHVNFQDDRPRPARRLNTRDRTEGDTTRKRTTHCDELRSSCCTASTFDFPRDPKHRSRATSGNVRSVFCKRLFYDVWRSRRRRARFWQQPKEKNKTNKENNKQKDTHKKENMDKYKTATHKKNKRKPQTCFANALSASIG